MNLFTRMFAGVEEPRFPHINAAPIDELPRDERPLPKPKKADADRLEPFLEGLKKRSTEPRRTAPPAAWPSHG